MHQNEWWNHQDLKHQLLFLPTHKWGQHWNVDRAEKTISETCPSVSDFSLCSTDPGLTRWYNPLRAASAESKPKWRATSLLTNTWEQWEQKHEFQGNQVENVGIELVLVLKLILLWWMAKMNPSLSNCPHHISFLFHELNAFHFYLYSSYFRTLSSIIQQLQKSDSLRWGSNGLSSYHITIRKHLIERLSGFLDLQGNRDPLVWG